MQVTVGRIGRPHGIRGDVVVGVRTDEPELRFAQGSRLDTDPVGVGPLTVAGSRWHSGELLVRFEGIGDRTPPANSRGTWLLVDSADARRRSDDPDEFRDGDLVGLSVRTVDGTVVGTVDDVLHSRPGRPASIKSAADGARRIMVPFVKAIVPEVDVAGGRTWSSTRPRACSTSKTPTAERARCGSTLSRSSRTTSGRSARTGGSVTSGPLGVSLIGKAGARGDIDFRVHDLRRWTTDVHHTVDDTPFGGGPGMVMKPDVWGAALDAVLAEAAPRRRPTPGRRAPRRGQPAPARLVVPTPSGAPFTQELAAAYAGEATSCSPAAGTRGSTRGSSPTPGRGWPWTRSASATTCSPGERRPSP